MTEIEARLECLKLALTQAKAESKHLDRKSIAEISTEFYNHINGSPVSVQKQEPISTADKSPSIFSDPARPKKK